MKNLERWRINLYVLWVTQIFSMIGFNIALPFTAYYFQEMGVTSLVKLNYYVGLSSTFPAITMAIFAPVWGIVADLHGRKLMIMRAMMAAAILLALLGLTDSVYVFLGLRLLQGIFTGTVGASMAFVSANTPEHRMSFALGFMTSSNFLGYAIGPVLGGVLAEIVGYKLCFVIGGALLFVGFLLVLILVKENPNTYGKVLREKKQADEEKPKLLNKYILLVLLMLLTARIARTVFAPFVALYVQERLGTIAGAAKYTGIINGVTGVATAVAALTFTRLGDKYDKFKLVMIFSIISLVISIFFIPKWPILIFAIIYGTYFLAAGSVEPILTSAASEVTDQSLRGQLFGTMSTVNSVAMIISPMIAASVSNAFSVSAILVLMPLLTVLQIIVLIISNRIRTSHTGEKKPVQQ